MALAEQNIETQVQEVEMVVTPSAVAVIKNLLQERSIPNYSLRVFVTGGGCSGMQYGMSFEESPREYDKVVTVDGVSLLVDPTSLVYLEGATIDFVDSLIGGGFRIDNPNAASSCGCGSSFKSKDGAGAEDASGGCGTCSTSSY
ncbi:MAG: iron-sulfur cluster insertion protein ErpA [Phototrophicaceae bacterium]